MALKKCRNVQHIMYIWCAHITALVIYLSGGRDSSVGKATRYGLDGRGSNSGGGEIFHTRPDRSWVPPNLLLQ